MNITQQLIDYECNELTEQETIQLFQYLINTGLVYQLQGHYGRTAQAMLESGAVQH